MNIDFQKSENKLPHAPECRNSAFGTGFFEIHTRDIPAHGIRVSDRKCVKMVNYRKCSASENMHVIVAITGLHYGQSASLLPELPINDIPGNPANGYSS
ncbi:hypothetical protein LGM71_08330 [Burkholderia sp. AU33545]|uniref:hypothetical protein n=1 Tax=Burkholderia sp. AU33545 TaxID=2879631 RepID=UPI001CF43EAB|nr:hypothetical protein [Burkholderia sp. AU33545]MCA8201052.1 hypothetical protein [Burkholderia sp. AU33545]